MNLMSACLLDHTILNHLPDGFVSGLDDVFGHLVDFVPHILRFWGALLQVWVRPLNGEGHVQDTVIVRVGADNVADPFASLLHGEVDLERGRLSVLGRRHLDSN
jgi:hypothetical protein